MKKILSLVLAIFITLMVINGCNSNNNKQINTTDNTTYSSTEKETDNSESTTYGSVENETDINVQESEITNEGLAIQEIKQTIITELQNQGYSSIEFTDESTKTEKGKTTTKFKFHDGIVSVSVIEKSSGIERITTGASLSAFGVDSETAFAVSTVFCLVPLSYCDSGMDTFSLLSNIISTTPETKNYGGTKTTEYKYHYNGWEYYLFLTDEVVGAVAAPTESN